MSASLLSVAPGEERAGVKKRATVTADAVEAAIGALYLDAGLDPARNVRSDRVGRQHCRHNPPPRRIPKTGLQEWAQARGHAVTEIRGGLTCRPIASSGVRAWRRRIEGAKGTVGAPVSEWPATSARRKRLAALALLAELRA